MSLKNTLDKAIKACDADYKLDQNELLVEIRERLREEYDAINKYLSMVPHIGDQKIVNIIKDIADEEKVHVGELEAILYNLDPNELSKAKEGMEENG